MAATEGGLLPAGGWRAGDKSNQIGRKVNLFTGAGYVFVSLNYRLSPADPTILEPGPGQVPRPSRRRRRGARLDRSDHIRQYGGDPTRLGLIGHSAGAHLVSLVTTDPSYIAALRRRALADDRHGRRSTATPTSSPTGSPSCRRTAGTSTTTPSARRPRTRQPARGRRRRRSSSPTPPTRAFCSSPRPTRCGSATTARWRSRSARTRNGVFVAPYDHEGINDAVGDPGDTAGETGGDHGVLRRAGSRPAVDPTAKLRKHPAKRVRSSRRRTKVTFKLASPEAGAGFECRLDSRRLKPCEARRSYLADRGRHTFRYRALLANGRPGPRRASSFRVAVAG